MGNVQDKGILTQQRGYPRKGEHMKIDTHQQKRWSMRVIVLVLVLLTLSMLLNTGCSLITPRPTPTPRSTNTPAATRPTPTAAVPQTPGGNLIMTLAARDPTTIDPALVGETVGSFVVLQLFSGLVRLDENLEVQPDLAETWDISEDGLTYTFTLRSDARFADGTPITTEDVRYSLERASDPTLSPFLRAETYLIDIVGVRDKIAGKADEIAGLNITNDRIMSLTIERPEQAFLSKLTLPTAFVVDQRTVEQMGDEWLEHPNGSGPFMIEEWEHDQRLVLTRNPNYYRDLARLDHVTLLMGASASNPLVLYEQGKIDITHVSSFALARVQDETNPLSKELRSVPQLSLSYIGMNVTIPPFDDPNVRKAFALLLDRQRLVEVTRSGSVAMARGILPPGMPGYNPDLPEPQVDIEQAKQLLAESTYGGAEGLPSFAAYGGGTTAILHDIVEEELGLTSMELRNFEEFGDHLTALQEKELPMYDLAWVADYPHPQNFLDILFRSSNPDNYSDYSNPRVDELLDKAAVEQDEETRWSYYQQAEQIILEDMPVIPLYHDVDHVLVKPYVKGLVVTPMGIMDLSTVELVR